MPSADWPRAKKEIVKERLACLTREIGLVIFSLLPAKNYRQTAKFFFWIGLVVGFFLRRFCKEFKPEGNSPRRKRHIRVSGDANISDSRRHPQLALVIILDMAGEKKKQQPFWLGYAKIQEEK